MGSRKRLTVDLIRRRNSSTGMVLPTEIIHNVISFMNPQDLIPLSEVSKQFHAVINDPAVWRTMYRNAQLPRPPGPFPWQSLWFLQRNLVRSARLAETWTSHEINAVSLSEYTIPPSSKPNDLRKWVCGRWVFVSMAMKRIVSMDFETHHQEFVWDDGPLSRWTACSIISAQGHFIYLVLRVGAGNDEDAVKLLEFRVADDDSGHISVLTTFDVPLECLAKPGLQAISTNAPFVYISTIDSQQSRLKRNRACVFDIRSRVFYKFPEFDSQLDEVRQSADCNCTREILVTTTHIVALSNFIADDDEKRQLIQAFIIPDDPLPDDGSRELRLSHETIQHGGLSKLSLIRKPITDPDSGSTSLRFLHISKSTNMKVTVLSTEFTLPKPGPDDVLPIAVDTHALFNVKGLEGGQSGCSIRVSGSGFDGGPCFVEASDDGFVRGLLVEDCLTETITGSGESRSYGISWDRCVRKFSLDAGDRCIAVVGDSSPASYALLLRHSEHAAFDGTRGLIGFQEKSRLPGGNIREVIKVLSIA